MERSRICFGVSLVVPMLVFVLGCGPSGPSTVPVKGTLTIAGQPANNVQISLIPVDTKLEPATGNVAGGAFTVFSGNQGKPGAMVGKYKVVLQAMAGGAEAAKQMYGGGGAAAGAKSSAAPEIKATFPDKYKDASTSDKEVEVVSGPNDLKIDILAE